MYGLGQRTARHRRSRAEFRLAGAGEVDCRRPDAQRPAEQGEPGGAGRVAEGQDPAEAEETDNADEAPARKKGGKVTTKPAARGGKAGAVKGKTSPKRGADDDEDEDDDRPSPQKKGTGRIFQPASASLAESVRLDFDGG